MAHARGGKRILILGALAGAVLFRGTVFVPPPAARHAQGAQASLAACSAALLGAAGDVHADAIEDAALKLTKAAYPFMKEVPWNSDLFAQAPGKADAAAWTKTIGKIIDMGAAMDWKLVKAGGVAHHNAIAAGLDSNGVCSEPQLAAINTAIGRMIASVPEKTTMDVYNSVQKLVDPKVPETLMSKVKADDAKAAYAALVDFAQVVKANPIKPEKAAASPMKPVVDGVVGKAAAKLSTVAYPFMKDIDWKADFYAKPVPGKSPQEALKAVDKMIVLGTQMDGTLLQEAAKAHVKAIQGVDAKGLLTQKDFEAINVGIGKAIASAPEKAVMDVYYQMNDLVGSSPIPDYLLSRVNAEDAKAAYKAFIEFERFVHRSGWVSGVVEIGSSSGFNGASPLGAQGR